MIYQKQIDVKYDVDVFVAGGGPSGVMAAVAAARQGKKVLLAEAQGALGGLATCALVPCFAVFGDGVNILADGIGSELRRMVSKEYPIETKWTPIHVEELKRAYDEIVTKAGVICSFFTQVCDVAANDGHVDYVLCYAKSGFFAVKAKIYIDCTGDGDLCAQGGAKFEMGDENGNVMPGTLCSMWANIDFTAQKYGQGSRLEDAIKDGVFTFADRHHSGVQEIGLDRQHGIGGGNIGHLFDVKPLDERSLTDAMIWGRKSMVEYTRYHHEYLPGFEKAELVYTPTMPGIRESRRITCDYTLNIGDFVKRAVFEDEIGRYCYPVDIHIMSTDEGEYKRFQQEYEHDFRYGDGESYGIPYRSLVPVSFSNVLTAGRCMGTDRQMEASIRVIPGCFITGQAAGTAAALACDKEDVRAISIAELQNQLKLNGAYLPNA